MSKYEAHITIEPVLDEARAATVKAICAKFGFRVAELLMAKRPTDTPERSRYDTFTTSNSDEYVDILTRARGLCSYLKDAGFKVWRYKIEETILDSKGGVDYWDVL